MAPMNCPPDETAVEFVPPPKATSVALARSAAEAAERAELASEDPIAPDSAGELVVSRPERPSPSPLALAGLFLVCLALPCLSFPDLRWAVVGLAIGSLVLAVASRFGNSFEQSRPLLLPLVTGGLAVAAGMIAGAFPGLFTITPSPGKPPPERDPALLYVIPIRGVGLKPAPEWAQADQYTLQRGDLRVRVLGGNLQLDPGANAPEQHVYLSVRLSHVAALRPIALTPLANAKGPSAPVLRHATGEPFSWVAPAPGTAVLPRDRLTPQESIDIVLTFQGCPREEDLLFELPALDGGPGPFRFRIPPSMIQR
jgi:hypothetical protein